MAYRNVGHKSQKLESGAQCFNDTKNKLKKAPMLVSWIALFRRSKQKNIELFAARQCRLYRHILLPAAVAVGVQNFI
jgi:hypothetical protein